MTTDPLHRLTAGLAEEERIARAALGQDHVHETFCDSERCVHDRLQNPRATLDRVEAIRKVIAEHARTEAGFCGTCVDPDPSDSLRPVQWPCPTLRALASMYDQDDAEDTEMAEES